MGKIYKRGGKEKRIMKELLQNVGKNELLLQKSAREGMNVDAKVFANQAIMKVMEDEAINQLSNVAMLPGVVAPVCAMPDAHVGYGLPMGAVGSFNSEDGVISAGCTGFDINCGVNLIRTNLTAQQVKEKLNQLVPTLFRNIPCGVGSKGKLRLNPQELDKVLTEGIDWAIANGYGTSDDKKHMEEEGVMEGADPSKISPLAMKRGVPQLGTLGAGNHFLELQKVSNIFDEKLAQEWGLQEGNACIMLHCGSRGFGHQVATDYLKVHEEAARKYGIKLPDRQLVCAPVNSKEGQDYFAAMKCAVNYAFTNRLVMTQWIRETFAQVFGQTWEEMEMKTVYGIAHNICKVEEFKVEGKKQKLYVHRKGATRSYPNTPAIIAGSMGTASYVLVGTETAMEKTFGSTCHGAGRAMSRHGAINKFRGGDIKRELAEKCIMTQSTSPKVLAEEAPLAYKDVEEVINSVHDSNISLKVARMTPLGVIKG
jgi:tRNA-splicing ligase RtcB